MGENIPLAHKAFTRDLGVGMCGTCLGNYKPFRKKMETRDYLSVGDNCHSSRDSEHLTQVVEERRGCEVWVGKRWLGKGRKDEGEGMLEGKMLTFPSFPRGRWSPHQIWGSFYFYSWIVLVLVPNYLFRASQSLDREHAIWLWSSSWRIFVLCLSCYFALKVSEGVSSMYRGRMSRSVRLPPLPP